ncbi:uncharacterized protein EV422DRAFT_612559 [Fimicolochytrium jonesii]|uniref:uncharacterized protein n=1 Tax=Fimicolochytrium jonesii TaxID=1396493 RepID=UPI0022FE60DD|nr:uncharacterized protein EV422DRAFT_612559 [Fimicolochytrium jonesii]KAI8815545.1 hypothetical protein EV422DRAFT_612559 [Fimicolochytrium jonesii]
MGICSFCNGGLSMRKRSTMLQITRNEQHILGVSMAEDIWFSQRVTSFPGATIPNRTIAAEFSVGATYHPRPFGMHQPRFAMQFQKYSRAQLNLLLQWCKHVSCCVLLDAIPQLKLSFLLRPSPNIGPVSS